MISDAVNNPSEEWDLNDYRNSDEWNELGPADQFDIELELKYAAARVEDIAMLMAEVKANRYVNDGLYREADLKRQGMIDMEGCPF